MAQFKEWWESISPREQQLSMLSGIVIFMAALYFGIWSPLAGQLSENKDQLASAESTLAWTQKNADILLKAGVGGASKKSGNLTKILNQTARRDYITFSRIVNKKDKVEVQIADVDFDSFVKWLANLSNQHKIGVLSADLAKSDREGYIKVNRLLLGNQ